MPNYKDLDDNLKDEVCDSLSNELIASKAKGREITPALVHQLATIELCGKKYCGEGFTFNGGSKPSFINYYIDWLVEKEEFKDIRYVLKVEKKAAPVKKTKVSSGAAGGGGDEEEEEGKAYESTQKYDEDEEEGRQMMETAKEKKADAEEMKKNADKLIRDADKMSKDGLKLKRDAQTARADKHLHPKTSSKKAKVSESASSVPAASAPASTEPETLANFVIKPENKDIYDLLRSKDAIKLSGNFKQIVSLTPDDVEKIGILRFNKLIEFKVVNDE